MKELFLVALEQFRLARPHMSYDEIMKTLKGYYTLLNKLYWVESSITREDYHEIKEKLLTVESDMKVGF